MAHLYLAVAIISEVIATSALKASIGFTRLAPIVLVITGYGTAFYCLSIVMKSMSMGVVYAIWSGVGIVLISLIGVVLFKQRLDLPAIIGIVLILLGVIIINLFSKSSGH